MSGKDSSVIKLAVTAVSGKYNFAAPGAGTYLISATHVGYSPVYSTPFEVSGTTEISVADMTIDKITGTLGDVTLTSKKPMVEVRADKTVLNIEGTINATGTDALGLLCKSPGVLVDKDDNLSLAGKKWSKGLYRRGTYAAGRCRPCQLPEINSVGTGGSDRTYHQSFCKI